MSVGDINAARRSVEIDGVALDLTTAEFDLLHLLAKHAGETLSRDDISQEILYDTALGLIDDYHWLEVNILIGDYEAGLAHLPKSDGRRLFCFLGRLIQVGFCLFRVLFRLFRWI